MTKWRVIGTRGCGSTIGEAALAMAKVPYDREEVDYATPSPARDRLLALNPLGQVPTLVLPDGSVMTESAAIVLHLDETHPEAGLLPRPGDPRRREALRWMMFVVAAIYPTFTYGDEPSKWVGDAGPRLRESTDAHRKLMWQQVEGAVRGPWFLGDQLSALDLYVGVMTYWRPSAPWFAEHTPKLAKIGKAIAADPRVQGVFDANFETAVG